MSIETELTALREAIEKLTAAVTGHAETRLRIFDRAYDDAANAIPVTPEELEFTMRKQAEPAGRPANDDAAPANDDAPFDTDPDLGTTAVVEEPAPAEVSAAEARALAVSLIQSGQRDRLRDILASIGVGTLDQLDAEQRVAFVGIVHGSKAAA